MAEQNREPQYPCSDHEHEMDSIRTLADTVQRELAVVREIVTRLDKAMFGNGSPGAISRIDNRHEGLCSRLDERFRAMDAKNEAKNQQQDNAIDAIKKQLWLAAGFISAWLFLSGNGVISLKALIGK